MSMDSHKNIYQIFFGMSELPFSVTPNPRFFVQSRTHLDALASLIYGIKERKGFITLSGAVGTGKTTVLRTLLENLDLNVVFSHIINTDVNFFELLQMICSDFGLDIDGCSKVELMGELFNFLVDNRLEGKTALVVVDEAQNLKPPVLEALRMLSNFETPREKLLQILLCGQPELISMLQRGSLKQLAQRIVVSAKLGTLSQKESEKYIYHRLALCGCNGNEIFPRTVVEEIATISEGIPRVINIISDNCLVLAYAEGRKVVTKNMVEEAKTQYFAIYEAHVELYTSSENGGEPGKRIDGAFIAKKKSKHRFARIAAILTLVALAIISIVILFSSGIITFSSNSDAIPGGTGNDTIPTSEATQ